jgi:hypothetical protein
VASEREAAGLSRSLAYMAALKAARFLDAPHAEFLAMPAPS